MASSRAATSSSSSWKTAVSTAIIS
uniref:Uncharacterized protein n=1 Tax=Arundo donax TaxID=35708 RepID=A0A0A9FDL8_ARUDO